MKRLENKINDQLTVIKQIIEKKLKGEAKKCASRTETILSEREVRSN